MWIIVVSASKRMTKAFAAKNSPESSGVEKEKFISIGATNFGQKSFTEKLLSARCYEICENKMKTLSSRWNLKERFSWKIRTEAMKSLSTIQFECFCMQSTNKKQTNPVLIIMLRKLPRNVFFLHFPENFRLTTGSKTSRDWKLQAEKKCTLLSRLLDSE